MGVKIGMPRLRSGERVGSGKRWRLAGEFEELIDRQGEDTAWATLHLRACSLFFVCLETTEYKAIALLSNISPSFCSAPLFPLTPAGLAHSGAPAAKSTKENSAQISKPTRSKKAISRT